MNNEIFQNFANEEGLKLVGKSAYGVIGNFPVKVQLHGNRTYMVFTLPEGEPKRLRAAADIALKGLGVSQISGPENLAVELELKDGDLKRAYDKVGAAMLGFFREFGVKAVTDCAFCGEPGCDCTVAQQTGSRYAHFNCITKLHVKRVSKAVHNQKTGRYLTGTLGGALGGLLACVPSLLTIGFFERIFAFLYALIPLGVYYGYKYGKGKSDKFAVAVTVGLSVFYAFLIEWLMLVFILISQGRPLAWMGAFVSENLSLLAGDILFSLIAVGIGIAFTWRQISRTLESDVTDTGTLMETVVSLDSPVSEERETSTAGAKTSQ